MKNTYVIRDGVGIIFVDAPPDAGYGYLEVRLDVADLETAKAWPGSWYGVNNKRDNAIYIRATKTTQPTPGYTQKQPFLHRVIARPSRGEVTQFKDGDSLNLQRRNLVNMPIGEKWKPVGDPTKLPIVRGVHWRPEKQRFEVRVFHKNKGYYLGVYPADEWKKANKVAELFRQLGPTKFFKKYPKGVNRV